MIFSEPIDFDAAIAVLKQKKLLPTNLSSAQIAKLREEFNLRGLFSSRTLNAQLLQGYKDQLESAGSQANLATMRAEIKKLIASLEIAPPSGEEAGTITDLGSNARIGLVLRTNLDMARGYGQWMEGISEGALQAFPALELLRVEDRVVPRDWIEIWDDATDELGDETTATDAEESGRMVALKGDPIWLAISDFGQPWPPFKYNSGMGVEDVDWQDAVDLGVVDAEDPAPEVAPIDFNQGVESSIAELAPEMVSVLEEGLQGLAMRIGDVLQLKPAATSKPIGNSAWRARLDETLDLLEAA
jgi:hypothetical protein